MRPLVRCFVSLAAVAVAFAAPRRVVNTFPLAFADGSGQIEWLSPSTFRFLRNWTEPEPIKEPLVPKPVAVTADESATAYSFKSRYLTVEVEKDGGRIAVRAGSKDVLIDGCVRRDSGRGVLEQHAAASERFYGLGARDAARFDLRGSAIETRDPFLLSSAGFAEYFPARGMYRFDLASSRLETMAVTAPAERVEFLLYYGPVPKDIFEEHLAVTGPIEPFGAADFKVRQPRGHAAAGSWDALAASLRTLLHASLSLDLIPEFDLAPYANADADLRASAAELACLMPVLRAPGAGAPFAATLRWRERLEPYLLSYTKEAQNRGVPVLRPLEIDSDEDPAARNRFGEFKVGDELLAAPVLKPDADLTVYLPRGLWTDLDSGETYKGRQEIRVRPPAGHIALFARNGTIVPLGPENGDVLELHYFPDLGAEFFLFEEGDQDISQFHAAPAGDLMRFEIESRVNRVYDWVMHDAGQPRKVDGGGVDFTPVADPAQLAPGCWYADPSKKLLRIRVRSVAGGDEVVHVTP